MAVNNAGEFGRRRLRQTNVDQGANHRRDRQNQSLVAAITPKIIVAVPRSTAEGQLDASGASLMVSGARHRRRDPDHRAVLKAFVVPRVPARRHLRSQTTTA